MSRGRRLRQGQPHRIGSGEATRTITAELDLEAARALVAFPPDVTSPQVKALTDRGRDQLREAISAAEAAPPGAGKLEAKVREDAESRRERAERASGSEPR